MTDTQTTTTPTTTQVHYAIEGLLQRRRIRGYELISVTLVSLKDGARKAWLPIDDIDTFVETPNRPDSLTADGTDIYLRIGDTWQWKNIAEPIGDVEAALFDRERPQPTASHLPPGDVLYGLVGAAVTAWKVGGTATYTGLDEVAARIRDLSPVKLRALLWQSPLAWLAHLGPGFQSAPGIPDGGWPRPLAVYQSIDGYLENITEPGSERPLSTPEDAPGGGTWASDTLLQLRIIAAASRDDVDASIDLGNLIGEAINTGRGAAIAWKIVQDIALNVLGALAADGDEDAVVAIARTNAMLTDREKATVGPSAYSIAVDYNAPEPQAAGEAAPFDPEPRP